MTTQLLYIIDTTDYRRFRVNIYECIIYTCDHVCIYTMNPSLKRSNEHIMDEDYQLHPTGCYGSRPGNAHPYCWRCRNHCRTGRQSSWAAWRGRPMHWTPIHWSRCCQHLSIVFSVLLKKIWQAPVDRTISLIFAISFDILVDDFHQYLCKSVCLVKCGITKVTSRYCDMCTRIPMILLWSNLLANGQFWPNKARTCPIAKAGRWGWCPSDSHQGGDVLGSCTTASSFKDEKTLIKLEKTPHLQSTTNICWSTIVTWPLTQLDVGMLFPGVLKIV